MSKLFQIKRPPGVWVFSLLGGIFGLMTLKSATAVLFFDEAARQAAGNYVPFVLWFNFLAGFIYIVAAIALWLMRPVALWLSVLIAAATLLVFLLLGVYIFNGGAYEVRTLVAMSLRFSIWLLISVYAWHFYANVRTDQV